MLITAPSQGTTHRYPNWVSTKPAPNPNIDARARKIAVVMGAIPDEKFDRGSKIVVRAIPNNAEVANPDLGEN